MPVRWGRFNPDDDNKILIATELGIWGLEAQDVANEQWVNYNMGFPNIRVDMFDIRAADNKILAATHGQGFLYGTLDQGTSLSTSNEKGYFSKSTLYPNPVDDILYLIRMSKSNHYKCLTLQARRFLRQKVQIKTQLM